MTAVDSGGKGLRIAVFTHDTSGLGHMRRCLRIIRKLAERAPEAAILLMTGSPAVQALRDLPPGADLVKIPTLVRTGAESSGPAHLPLELIELTRLRRTLIRMAIVGFGPDVLVVDDFPLGSRRELLPTLEDLRILGGRAVLGLRDILDAPDVVRETWQRQGILEVLDHRYARILVYGSRTIFDVAEAYGLSPKASRKVRYCGYVTDAPPRTSPGSASRALGLESPFLLVSGGEGGDGFPLLAAVLDALPRVMDLPAVLVAGPLMGTSDRETLRVRAAGGKEVTFLDEVSDLPGLMADAEVVVTMCGYDIAAEIAAVRPRAIVVPRTWKFGAHRLGEAVEAGWEQTLRARALERMGLVRVIAAPELSPRRLAEEIAGLRSGPRPDPAAGLDLGGADRVADEILSLAAASLEGSHAAS